MFAAALAGFDSFFFFFVSAAFNRWSGSTRKIHLTCLLRPVVRVCAVCVLFLFCFFVPLVSDTDKKRIMTWSHKGKGFFEQEDGEERR